MILTLFLLWFCVSVIVPTLWFAVCGVRVLFYEILKPTARASVTVYPRFSFLASGDIPSRRNALGRGRISPGFARGKQ